MTEAWIDKALERVARDAYILVMHNYHDTVSSPEDILSVLTRELGPLLQAGQAMRDHVDTLSYEDENEPHNCSGCGKAIKTWDAAKAKLLRGAE
jgi:branched-subunit amino acid aminotransferase/4-amino-4-deoxychorismate lyase